MIEAVWHIYASVDQAIVGSDNALSLAWSQAISWTHAGVLSIEPSGINCVKFELK